VTQLEGHESTCFGCIATGSSILSWSGDGSILEWDAVNMRCGVVDTPLGRRQLPDFPVYSCATTKDGRYLLCAGGTSSGKAFMGVPVNVIDLAA
jgi:WD40 repeat protein